MRLVIDEFQADLQAASSDITHSIVRPTAFFKSVAGQIEASVTSKLENWTYRGELCYYSLPHDLMEKV